MHWIAAIVLAVFILIVLPLCKMANAGTTEQQAYDRGREAADEHKRLQSAYEQGYADGLGS
jgi:hypothetical protein